MPSTTSTAGMAVVLVAPFTAERSDPAAWSATHDRLAAAGGTAAAGLAAPCARRSAAPVARARCGEGRGQARRRGGLPCRVGRDVCAARRSASRAGRHPACRRAGECRPRRRSLTSDLALAIDGKTLTCLCHRWHNEETWVAKSILRDVAEVAGVSLRTASRVLNEDPRVAVATRARVQQAMRDLKFTPDCDGAVPAFRHRHRRRHGRRVGGRPVLLRDGGRRRAGRIDKRQVGARGLDTR